MVLGPLTTVKPAPFQFLGQRIDLFFAANTESDMGIPGAVQGFLLIRLYASSSIPKFNAANTIK